MEMVVYEPLECIQGLYPTYAQRTRQRATAETPVNVLNRFGCDNSFLCI